MCRTDLFKKAEQTYRRHAFGSPSSRLHVVATYLLPLAGLWSSPGLARTLPVADFAAIAESCGPSVDKSTLASVAATESGFEPLVVHDNTTGATATMDSPEQGAAAVEHLIAARHSVDVGLMQINSQNFAALDLDTTTAFDPCASIAAAAKLLSQAYAGGATHEAQQASLRGALSTYNTGNSDSGLRNGYVRRVELAMTRVVPAIDTPRSRDAAPAPVTLSALQPEVAEQSTDWEIWSDKERASSTAVGIEPVVINFEGEGNHG